MKLRDKLKNILTEPDDEFDDELILEDPKFFSKLTNVFFENDESYIDDDKQKELENRLRVIVENNEIITPREFETLPKTLDGKTIIMINIDPVYDEKGNLIESGDCNSNNSNIIVIKVSENPPSKVVKFPGN